MDFSISQLERPKDLEHCILSEETIHLMIELIKSKGFNVGNEFGRWAKLGNAHN